MWRHICYCQFCILDVYFAVQFSQIQVNYLAYCSDLIDCEFGWLHGVVVNTLVFISIVALHCLAGVRRGEFTCVGWQVTLCDPIWQVMPRNSEMTCHEELYRLPLALTLHWAWLLLGWVTVS